MSFLFFFFFSPFFCSLSFCSLFISFRDTQSKSVAHSYVRSYLIEHKIIIETDCDWTFEKSEMLFLVNIDFNSDFIWRKICFLLSTHYCFFFLRLVLFPSRGFCVISSFFLLDRLLSIALYPEGENPCSSRCLKQWSIDRQPSVHIIAREVRTDRS